MPEPTWMCARIAVSAVAAAFAAVLTAAAPGPAVGQEFTMKMGGIAVNDPSHHYLKRFAELIEEKSGERIEGKVFPGAQIGGFPQMIQGVQLGTLELFTGPPGFLKGVDSRFQVADAPGLFEDMAHAHRAYTDPAFRNRFLDIAVDKGIQGVSLWVYGPTSYIATTPLRGLQDFRGKKFRVLATKVETTLMDRLGATGVPMDFPEVLPALQRGVIDGVRSSIVVTGAMKFFDAAKYITLVNDAMIPLGGYASVAFLNRLPEDLRETVIAVGKQVEEEMLGVALEFDARAEDLWRKNGAEIIHLSEKDQAEFMRIARGVSEAVLAADSRLEPLYRAFVEAAKRNRGG